jgi:multicomponent Na+:H+ antiporter subunit G
MTTLIDMVAAFLLVSGVAFLAISALGLIRFPDFWTRAHAVAKAETLGLVLVFLGLIVLHRFGPGSVQLALIAGFSLLVNPTAIHALARSAVRRPEVLQVHSGGDDGDGGTEFAERAVDEVDHAEIDRDEVDPR